MSEERTYKGHDLIEENTNGCITFLIARLAQIVTGFVGGSYLAKDVVENGFNLSNSLGLAVTLGVILGIEQLVRSDAKQSSDMYSESGVDVEEY